ncbi:MAG: YidB family protein [Hydrogenophaga sp.]|uniref:YidB family protein n=1 Tax=Hydrogenophaga sp. TaxID=1904254 RepID=UPI002617B95B|nr:YidB family protein [Hydrogenophaga sp.]MDM7943339.1 YidB family protein [Hydrogenophaga sp.]
MGLLDSLMGAATQAAMGARREPGAAPPGGAGGLDPQLLITLVSTLFTHGGGLQGLLARLQSAGLGETAQSWVGTGANQPVNPEQLGQALGPDLMGMIAAQLGGRQEEASTALAELLPGLIDQLTPQGRVPADDGLGALGDLLGTRGSPAGADLMGMLGGLMQPRR